MNDDTSILLDRAASRLEPDVDRLVSAGTARGRRLRRRHRAGAGIAGAAVVGVVAASAAVVPALLDDDRPTGANVSDGTSPLPSEMVQSDTAEPTPDPAPTPRVAIKAGQIPALVRGLYDGEITEGNPDHGGIMNLGEAGQVAHFRWNGFAISAGVTAGQTQAGPLQRCRALSAPGAECVPRPDGSVVLRGSDTGPAQDGGVSSRSVSLYVPGYDVFAMAYNAGEGKGSPVLADEPPFSYEQLTAIVDDPSWFD